MNSSNYKIVFALNLYHSFFEDGINNTWEYNPSPNTLQIIQRYGFKIRTTTTGIELYANTQDSIEKYLKYITTTTDSSEFEFSIDTSFQFIDMASDIPASEVGYLEYDNHSENNVSEDEKVVLDGKWVPSQTTNDFAKLIIHFDKLETQTESNKAINYQINIKARETQWQYLIINQSQLNVDNLKIKGKSEIQFEGPEDEMLPNGQAALKFISGNTLIPLSEIPKYSFDLIAGNDKVLIKGLPNPSLSQFGQIEKDEHTIVTSPMYVYI